MCFPLFAFSTKGVITFISSKKFGNGLPRKVGSGGSLKRVISKSFCDMWSLIEEHLVRLMEVCNSVLLFGKFFSEMELGNFVLQRRARMFIAVCGFVGYRKMPQSSVASG